MKKLRRCRPVYMNMHAGKQQLVRGIVQPESDQWQIQELK